MTINKQRIMERIEGLLRLSKSSNQHEAELATQRASELIEKYQISMTALDVSHVRSKTNGQTS